MSTDDGAGEKGSGERSFSQEELEKIIGDRLRRDRETRAGELTAALAEVERLKGEVTALKSEEDLKILRRKIARETGLPEGLAGRLQGATSTELENDAKALLAALGPRDKIGSGTNPPDTTPRFSRSEIEAMTPDEVVKHMPQIEKQLAEGTLR